MANSINEPIRANKKRIGEVLVGAGLIILGVVVNILAHWREQQRLQAAATAAYRAGGR